MERGAAWPAPGKINLFLHVVGRRADGYHLLQTVFQFIDVCDQLDFTVRDDGRIGRTTALAGVAAADDLVVRAARALQQATGCPLGVDIRLAKVLPMGGGLGGGSSDAATVLVALNELWDTGLSVADLAALGLALGADVPVFVHGHTAWAEGVGEVLEPMDFPELPLAVITPDCGVRTADIFAAADLTRDTPPIKMHAFSLARSRNDCEPITRRLYPEVGRALEWLGRHAPARMSGTGASVFASFDDEAAARAVVADLPAGWRGFATRRVNRSPLLDRLAVARGD